MALHLGDVLYGNIGSTGRLDFTTVGPGVNLTARLETLARYLSATWWSLPGSPRMSRGT
jgi:adenylate cyclase